MEGSYQKYEKPLQYKATLREKNILIVFRKILELEKCKIKYKIFMEGF